MDEAGHIPGQLWGGYEQIALDGSTLWTVYTVGGIPTPSAQLLHFQLTPESSSITQGFLTLVVPTQAPHGIQIPSTTAYAAPVKVWNVQASTTGNNPQVYEFAPAIPIAFDTAAFTFGLLNGDPYNLAPKVSGQFSALLTVIPFH